MLRAFFSYYRPHRRLFLLDFGCAVLSGLLELGFPMAVKAFVDELLPQGDWPLILLAAAGLLLVSRTSVALLVDGRYDVAARDAVAAGRLGPVAVERVERRYDQGLAGALTRAGVRRAAFEAAHVTVSTLDAWHRAAPDVAWEPTERVVEGQRIVKDAAEIAIFRRAAAALDGVTAALGSVVARDRTEREVAAGIDAALAHAGFEKPAFTTIVASGPNSALPHARPTERRLREGDLVVLDFGGVLDGYCVDLTRMAAVGSGRCMIIACSGR